jgi:DNA-binding NtrC family response regulator
MLGALAVLIVEANADVGRRYAARFGRSGSRAVTAETDVSAIEALREGEFDVIVLNLGLPDGTAAGIADFANYRQPKAKLVLLTTSDSTWGGETFRFFGNVAALLDADLPPDDLAAIVEYHAATK